MSRATIYYLVGGLTGTVLTVWFGPVGAGLGIVGAAVFLALTEGRLP